MKTIAFKSIIRLLNEDKGLTKKAYLNAIAALMDYGIGLLVSFLINPLLISYLGDYLYGVWQILLRATGYMSAASGRPSQTLKWKLAAQQASTDYDEKRRNVGSAVIVWLIFLPVLIIAGGCLAWFIPSLLNTSKEHIGNVRIAAGLLIANLVLITLADLPRSVLQGENLGYKRLGLTVLLELLGGGLIALALILNTGIIGVASANIVITIFSGLLFLQVVNIYVPWFGIASPSFRAVNQFLGLSGWFLAWNLIIQMLMSSDVIVLGMFDSPELVTIYSLSKFVPETIISLVSVVVFGITPGLGKIIGSGDSKRAICIRNEIMVLTWLLATVVGTTTIIWNKSFLELWVGRNYYAGPVSSLLIMLSITQFILIRNDANIIDLTLDLQSKVLMGAGSVVISFGLSYIFVGYFRLGILGVCLGFMIGRSILSLSYPWIIGRFLGIPLLVQVKSLPRPAFVMLLLFSIAYAMTNVLTVTTWIEFIILVAVTLLIVFPCAFYIGLDYKQRDQILKRFTIVMKYS